MKLFSKGFTLIEIMVVIVIISILSVALYANFTDARNDARDKNIRTELKEMQLALELYKAQNAAHPLTANIDDLVPDYIKELPDASASANSGCDYEYFAETDGSFYKLTAKNCIGGSAIEAEDVMARCPEECSSGDCGGAGNAYNASASSFYESLAVYSMGGQCE
jgi:prepilin-type N-terminal cleavage/methylation domain-containing protein